MSRPPDLWDRPAPRDAAEPPARTRRPAVAGLLVAALAVAAALGVFFVGDGAADPQPAGDQGQARVVELPVSTTANDEAKPLPAPIAAAPAAVPLQTVRDDISLVHNRVEFDLQNAPANEVLPRLAKITGARLSGLEALSGADARITLQGTWRSGLDAWKAVLEGINSILSCSARSCDVWILAAPRQGAGGALASPATVRSAMAAESDDAEAPAPAPPSPARVTPAPIPAPGGTSSEESSEN